MPSSFLKQLGCWVGVHIHWYTKWRITARRKMDIDGKQWNEELWEKKCTKPHCGKVKYRLERIF